MKRKLVFTSTRSHGIGNSTRKNSRKIRLDLKKTDVIYEDETYYPNNVFESDEVKIIVESIEKLAVFKKLGRLDKFVDLRSALLKMFSPKELSSATGIPPYKISRKLKIRSRERNVLAVYRWKVSDSLRQEVERFYESSVISYELPDMRYCHHKYMRMCIHEAYLIYKANKMSEEEDDDDTEKLSGPSLNEEQDKTEEKKLIEKGTQRLAEEDKHSENQKKKRKKERIIASSTFAKLRPKSVKKIEETPLRQCVCDSCENFRQDIISLHSIKVEGVHKNAKKTIQQSICSHSVIEGEKVEDRNILIPNITCSTGKCKVCTYKREKMRLIGLNPKIFASDKLVKWLRWVRPDDKSAVTNSKITTTGAEKKFKNMICVEFVGKPIELLEVFITDLVYMRRHHFYNVWQGYQFQLCKANLQPNQIILVQDFARNFLLDFQDEPQVIHWEHCQVTVHPTVAYFCCEVENCSELVTSEYVHVTPDLKHDPYAVKQFTTEVIEQLDAQKIKHDELFMWTDQAPTQYKSRRVFERIANGDQQISHNYYPVKHGKNSADGSAGRVKWYLHRAKTGRKVIMRSIKQLHSYAEEKLNTPPPKPGICQHYRRKVMICEEIERYEQNPSKTIEKTHEIHSVRSFGISNLVQIRNTTCCCRNCMTGDDNCLYSHIADCWQLRSVVGKVKNPNVKRNHWKNKNLSEEEMAKIKEVSEYRLGKIGLKENVILEERKVEKRQLETMADPNIIGLIKRRKQNNESEEQDDTSSQESGEEDVNDALPNDIEVIEERKKDRKKALMDLKMKLVKVDAEIEKKKKETKDSEKLKKKETKQSLPDKKKKELLIPSERQRPLKWEEIQRQLEESDEESNNEVEEARGKKHSSKKTIPMKRENGIKKIEESDDEVEVSRGKRVAQKRKIPNKKKKLEEIESTKGKRHASRRIPIKRKQMEEIEESDEEVQETIGERCASRRIPINRQKKKEIEESDEEVQKTVGKRRRKQIAQKIEECAELDEEVQKTVGKRRRKQIAQKIEECAEIEESCDSDDEWQPPNKFIERAMAKIKAAQDRANKYAEKLKESHETVESEDWTAPRHSKDTAKKLEEWNESICNSHTHYNRGIQWISATRSNALDWNNLLHELQLESTVEGLAEKLKIVDQHPIEVKPSVQWKKEHGDRIALFQFPFDGPTNLKPVKVVGDGNCCSRSLSMLAFGTESRYQEMKVRIIKEAVDNKAYYLNNGSLVHGLFEDFQDLDIVNYYVNTSRSVELVQPKVINAESIEQIYDAENLRITKHCAWMGMWQLHQGCSVIKLPLRIVYPHINLRDRHLMNRLVYPRGVNSQCHDNELGVMWTSTNDVTFEIDHFVPLLPV